MKYPRVIIIGETFRSNGGGGITLSNLFCNWPAENIGVITENIADTNPHLGYKYYQLGSDEIRFPFPFNLIQADIHSGPYHFDIEVNKSVVPVIKNNILLKLKFQIRLLFDKILNFTGLVFFFYKIHLSNSLRDWIFDFSPDIIYIQPFHYRVMRFGNLLYSKLKIPYAVHIMDDSVKYLNKSIVLRKQRQYQIEKDFERLISNAKVCMSISQAMSDEYFRRYGKSFAPFRNPINVDKWKSYMKNDTNVDNQLLKIIYTGRLFSPTYSSLVDLCGVVDGLNKNGKMVELDIYTHDRNIIFSHAIQNMTGINIYLPVDSDEMPNIISRYDIFFICLDFDNEAQKYSQYSISTRTSEGMISGVPVLVYAPANSALYRYFSPEDSGCIVGERNLDQLESSVVKLWEDEAFRKRISTNAISTALLDSDSILICEKFRKTLTYFWNE